MEEEWREEGEEGGRGEYYRKTAGLREIISSTGAVANELKTILLKSSGNKDSKKVYYVGV